MLGRSEVRKDDFSIIFIQFYASISYFLPDWLAASTCLKINSFWIGDLVKTHKDGQNTCKTYMFRERIAFFSGYPLKLHFQIPCVFPAQPQIFRANVSDLWLLQIQNWLGRLKNVFKFTLQVSKYLLLLESGNLESGKTKFPGFWQYFQIPCVFPDWLFLAIFPVQWAICFLPLYILH